MLMMMLMMKNCFCGMVDRWKAFSLISSRDHCQRSSPWRISDTPRAGFEAPQNLNSGLVEWSCAVVITTAASCSSRFQICIKRNQERVYVKFSSGLIHNCRWFTRFFDLFQFQSTLEIFSFNVFKKVSSSFT